MGAYLVQPVDCFVEVLLSCKRSVLVKPVRAESDTSFSWIKRSWKGTKSIFLCKINPSDPILSRIDLGKFAYNIYIKHPVIPWFPRLAFLQPFWSVIEVLPYISSDRRFCLHRREQFRFMSFQLFTRNWRIDKNDLWKWNSGWWVEIGCWKHTIGWDGVSGCVYTAKILRAYTDPAPAECPHSTISCMELCTVPKRPDLTRVAKASA